MDLLEKTAPVITPALDENIVVDRGPELMREAAPFDRARWHGAVMRHVFITPADIAAGQKGDGETCAIARAWKRQYPGDTVNISGDKPVVNGSRIDIPPMLVEWISRFDRGELDGTTDTLELCVYGE